MKGIRRGRLGHCVRSSPYFNFGLSHSLLCHLRLLAFAISIMSQRFSAADVASHNKADNLWIIVDEDVYDVTKFQDEHPGGKKSGSYRADCAQSRS